MRLATGPAQSTRNVAVCFRIVVSCLAQPHCQASNRAMNNHRRVRSILGRYAYSYPSEYVPAMLSQEQACARMAVAEWGCLWSLEKRRGARWRSTSSRHKTFSLAPVLHPTPPRPIRSTIDVETPRNRQVCERALIPSLTMKASPFLEVTSY